MIRKRAIIVFIAVGFLFNLYSVAQAPVAPATAAKPLPFVSPIFGDNMVLQRGKVNTLWGWSEPGDKVEVEVAGKHASGVAGADRRWQVQIHPPRPGGPYALTI